MNRRKRWTDRELVYLRRWYGHATAAAIAAKLGCDRKPATIAVDLDVTTEEVEEALASRPAWFRRGLAGVEAE